MAEERKASEAARALGRLGAAEGGRARAAKLSPEQRRSIAQQAAAARWGKIANVATLPVAVYGSSDRPLRIGNVDIPCYVLDDDRRVLSQRGFQGGVGLSRSGAKGGARRLAHFLASLERKGIDVKGLTARAERPITFTLPQGGKALGYEATILPDFCDVVLEARQRGTLLKQQEHVARQCEILLRAFAQVGIIALVDEATGYQDVRTRDALARILEAFIAKELRPWAKTFQPDFYKQLFRLRAIAYTGAPQKPAYIGKLTDDLVYQRLAPGVREELRRVNPADEHGRRKYRHHQWLTEDIGHPKLREHLAAVTAMMKAEDRWDVFKRKLDRVFPAYGKNMVLPLPELEDA